MSRTILNGYSYSGTYFLAFCDVLHTTDFDAFFLRQTKSCFGNEVRRSTIFTTGGLFPFI